MMLVRIPESRLDTVAAIFVAALIATGSGVGAADADTVHSGADASISMPAHSPAVTSCEAAIDMAERKLNLPPGLLMAMGKVEAMYQGRIWPWSLNVRGQKFRHPTFEAALDHLRRLIAEGETVIDVGCLQLNTYWVARGMPLEKTLDPEANALTAAFHLRDLMKRYETWSAAVANYHSGRTEIQARYICRVGIAFAKIRSVPPPDCDPA